MDHHASGTGKIAEALRSLLLAGLALGMLQSAALAESAPVPTGFQFLCMDHPGECRGGGASSVQVTPQLLSLLNEVNKSVNASIKPAPFEPIDIWSLNVRQGDCEDYVLAKRRALIRRGVPASALSIVYALRNGGGHAILALHTNEATLALDNMSSRIKPLNRTGYKVVSMSGPDPRVWYRP